MSCRFLLGLFASLIPLAAQAQTRPACQAEATVFPETTLARLADRYFGDVEYRHAILLATNARVSEGFPLILDPFDLPKGKALCIPVLSEAEVERNRFLTYLEAVRDMALPVPSEVTRDLANINPDKPVRVVSWVRADQKGAYEARLGQPADDMGKQAWVTLAPHVQDFCQGYAKGRGAELAAMTLRLEQRLGLAPHSAKTHFVEFEIANPGHPTQIFRPCTSPDVTTTSCAFGKLETCNAGDDACHRHYDFFTTQYYMSYGTSQPTEFPWTSLGYTFDWAHAPLGLGERPNFLQYGESEYVVPAEAQVSVISVQDTASYCGIAPY